MDVREKLVELLGRCASEESITIEPVAESRLVDFLVNHGVTVQKWISVTERLPESGKESVLIALRWGEVDIGLCEDGRWRSEFVNEYEDGEVTHWMPLPNLPKGE